MYSLFAIDAAISSEDFIPMVSHTVNKEVLTPIFDESFNPPLLLQSKNTKQIWAFSVGEPHEVLASWSAYAIHADGVQKQCSITFRPDVHDMMRLLPQSVQKLARLLDDTLGDGKDEGTLQETAHTRIEVQHAWANIALRPWGMAAKFPYNSREQADLELTQWKDKAKSFAALYDAIYALYPKAELDLAAYYQREFGKNSKEAKVLAAELLDKVFRLHFVFSE